MWRKILSSSEEASSLDSFLGLAACFRAGEVPSSINSGIIIG